MNQYEVIAPLLPAAHGEMFRVRRTRDGKPFVMRKVSYTSIPKSERKRLVDTTNQLIQLTSTSTSLIRYHNTQVDNEAGTLNLILEFCPNGSLERLIAEAKQARRPIETDKIWSIATDIALGLYDLHHNRHLPLAHGQLTADHVLFESDDKAKIGCFSLNSCFEVDKEKDLSDLGALIYEMATLSPFASKRDVTASRLRAVDEGLKELLIALLNPVHVGTQLTLLNVLEWPEIALNVLQKKLKIETEIYEQEKRRFAALKEEGMNREKRVQIESDFDAPSESI
jgi:serine/threonine protein kinase